MHQAFYNFIQNLIKNGAKVEMTKAKVYDMHI